MKEDLLKEDLLIDIAATTQLKQGQAIEFLGRVLDNPEAVTDLQLFAAEQLLRLYPEDTEALKVEDFNGIREVALHTLSSAMNGFQPPDRSLAMQQRTLNAASLICTYLSLFEGNVPCPRDDDGGSYGFLS